VATHTINLRDAIEARLALLVAEYNVATGSALTADEWIAMSVKEATMRREIHESGEAIRLQARVDAEIAVRAARDAILKDPAVPPDEPR